MHKLTQLFYESDTNITAKSWYFKTNESSSVLYNFFFYNELSSVFYNPYPDIFYNFPISSKFLNSRYFDFALLCNLLFYLATDQDYFDLFHISFIVYDIDESRSYAQSPPSRYI